MKIIDKGRMARMFISIVFFCANATAGTQALAEDQAATHPDNWSSRGAVTHEGERPQLCHGPRTGGEERRHGMHAALWHALKKLDLTEDQKTAIHQIKISMKKDMIQKRADLKIAQLEFRERLHKDIVDMGQIESQLKKVQDLKTAMMLNAIKAREKIKGTLTPEQRKKLTELMLASRMDHKHMRPQG